MNPWDGTVPVLGWIVFALVATVAVVLALVLLLIVIVVIVSIVQELVKAIRGRTRPKLGSVIPFQRKADDS